MIKKIFILAGGYSKEREVSLDTAKSIFGELRKDKQYKIYIQSINSSLDYEPAIVDFIFLKFNKKTVHHLYNKFKKSRIEFFIKKKIIKHSNIEFKIPSNTNKYLSSIYGKKWKLRPKFWVNKLALKNIQNK